MLNRHWNRRFTQIHVKTCCLALTSFWQTAIIETATSKANSLVWHLANLIVQCHPQKHLTILPHICLIAFFLPNSRSKWTSSFCVDTQCINVRTIHVIPKWNACTRSCVAWNYSTNKSSCIILLPRKWRFNIGIGTIYYRNRKLIIN